MNIMGGVEITERILITLPLSPDDSATLRAVDGLRERWPSVEFTYVQAKPDDSPDPLIFRDKTILITLFTLPPPKTDYCSIKWIHFISAGTNAIVNHPIYTHSDIPLTTSSGIHGPQIAEWCIMTALTQSHHYHGLYELQKKREWGNNTRSKTVHDMVGRRLGVLGYGSIGRQVARLGHNMGMEVLAYTATPKDTAEKKRDAGYIVPGTGDPDGVYPTAWFSGLDKPSLHDFLRQGIDMLVVSLPLTAETKHMLSKAEFDILAQRHALVLNISRGAVIDQPALIDALNDDRLSGACVDVTDPEPLPPDDPLWRAKNIIVTPHVSGVVSSYMERAFDVMERNMERRAAGRPLINVVDRKRGY